MIDHLKGPGRSALAGTLARVRLGSEVLALLLLSACSSEARIRPSQGRPEGMLQTSAGTPANATPVRTDNPTQLLGGSPANPPPAGAAAAAPPAVGRTASPAAAPAVAIVDECPGMLDPALVATLQAGDVQRGSRWLYPYDQTVIPRGLLAPVLQWDGPPASAIYLHMQSKAFDYKGCFKAGSAPNLTIPQTAWERA